MLFPNAHGWYFDVFLHVKRREYRLLHALYIPSQKQSMAYIIVLWDGYKAVSDGGVFNIRSLIHLVTLQLLYRHTHRHTDTQSL